VLRAPESVGIRCHRAGGARLGDRLAVYGRDDRVWAHLYCDSADHQRHHLLAARLQVNDRSHRAIVVAIVAVVVFGAISVRLQALRARLPLATSEGETLYVTERAASRAVFTHRPLAADVYWIRAIQYFGGRARISRESRSDPFEPPPSIAAVV